MINPGENCAKRSQEIANQLADLTFEYYKLNEQMRDNAKRIRQIDLAITDLLGAARTNNMMAKDFDTYLAVKENAVTLDDIKKGVQLAGNEE